MLATICDRSEQKQPFGWVLTNPLHVTPLRPDSTVIDGFSKLIPQRIAVEISYLLVYCFWKSINNCGAGTQWRNVWWIRQDPPKRLLLLGAVTYVKRYFTASVTFVFLIFWLPYFVVFAVLQLNLTSYIVKDIVRMIHFLNSTVNPVVYAIQTWA